MCATAHPDPDRVIGEVAAANLRHFPLGRLCMRLIVDLDNYKPDNNAHVHFAGRFRHLRLDLNASLSIYIYASGVFQCVAFFSPRRSHLWLLSPAERNCIGGGTHAGSAQAHLGASDCISFSRERTALEDECVVALRRRLIYFVVVNDANKEFMPTIRLVCTSGAPNMAARWRQKHMTNLQWKLPKNAENLILNYSKHLGDFI